MTIKNLLSSSCAILILAFSAGNALAENSAMLPIESIIHKIADDGYDVHSIFCRDGDICIAAVADKSNNLMIVAVNGRTASILERSVFGHAVHADIQGREISGDAAVKSVQALGKFKIVSMEYEMAAFVVHVKDDKNSARTFRVDERDGKVEEVKK